MTTPPISASARSTLLTLSCGRCCADFCASAARALLPFLVVERHYSYAAAGVFALCVSIAGALLQPLFGAHGDRRGAPWLMPAGLLVAGLGIGVAGLVTSYPLTLLAVALCSAGVAAYQPEGARWVRLVAGNRTTSSMAVFSVGGGIGGVLGPLLVVAALAPLGMHGTPLLMALPMAAAVAVYFSLRRFRARAPASSPAGAPTAARGAEWGPFTLLALFYAVESGIFIGLLTYLPLFLISARGTSPGLSNAMASLLLGAAAVGTLVGGRASERIGRRIVMVAPRLLLVPAIAVLPSVGVVEMVPLVFLIGLAVNADVSTAIVVAQEYLPARVGLASGVIVGLCSGVGGLIAAALGVVGSAAGPAVVLYVMAGLPLVATAAAAALPRPAASPPEAMWSLRTESGS